MNVTRPILILSVDDEPDIGYLTKEFLQTNPFLEVDVAGSVAEARAAMAARKYDVIISDYQMPGEDGIHFLKSLRASGDLTPFILFTGKGREDVVIEAINNGADAYLQKGGEPVAQFAELEHRINTTVRRHRVEAQLMDSESEFRTLFEENPDAIALVNLEGKILNCNQAAALMVLKSKEEIIGGTIADLGVFSPPDLAMFQRNMGAKVRGDPVSPIICQVHRKDGVVKWVDIRSSIVRKSGRFHSFQIICRDITEKRKAEDDLIRSEGKFRAIFNEAPVGIATISLDGKPSDFNEELNHFGYSKEEFTRMSFAEFTHPDDRERNIALFNDLVAGRIDRFEMEKRYVCKDGSIVWARLYEKKVEGQGGEPPVIVAIVDNLTDLKKAEEARLQSAFRLRTLVQTIPDMVWLKDLDGAYLFCNTMFECLYGADEEAILGRTDYDFVDKEVADSFREHDRRAIEAGGPTSNEEWVTFKCDGHCALIETIKTPLYDAQGVLIGVLGIGRDITERKRAEEELGKQTAKLSILNEIISIANRAEDLPQLLDAILSESIRLLDFDSGGIYLVDHGRRSATIVSQKNLPRILFDEVRVVPIDQKPFDTLFIMNEPIIAENFAKINPDRSKKYGILSLASIPLVSKGKAIGAMNIASHRRHQISDEDQQTLISIGRELGNTVSRMLTEEEVRKRCQQS